MPREENMALAIPINRQPSAFADADGDSLPPSKAPKALNPFAKRREK